MSTRILVLLVLKGRIYSDPINYICAAMLIEIVSETSAFEKKYFKLNNRITHEMELVHYACQ